MLIHQFLENSAARFPDKIALISSGKRITYSQLDRSASVLASWFIKSGMQKGDRVLILLENGEEYVTSDYAALKAGMVVVPISSETRSAALQNILVAITPRIVIASQKAEKALHEIADLPPSINAVIFTNPRLSWQQRPFSTIQFNSILDGDKISPSTAFDDSSLASIIFTSGSTGRPKGVMLTHANIVANTRSIIQYLELTEADRQMVVLPFFYVMGKSLLNTHVAVGGTIVINNIFAYPASVIQQMIDEQVTGFSGVPSTYAYLLHRSPLRSFKNKLGSLRYCSQAGGHLARHTKEEILKALPNHTKMFVMYGATEAAARLTYVEPYRLCDKIDSIGIPIPGVTMKVLDENGNELPQGETGELVANGQNIMSGYWNDPKSTSKVLSQHGYHTGDIGYMDGDGYFYVVGRRDNQLKVGGHRVNPQEIEDTLISTELVVECAVLGIPDQLAGHRLVAVAVPVHEEISERDILFGCSKILPRYKLPSTICLVKMLPKNCSGKVDRGACTDMFAKNIRDKENI